MSDGSDPRVFFAAERTLLAWLRTGMAVMAMGFVISRFGLFLRAIRNQTPPTTFPVGSVTIGVALVVLGGIVIFGSAIQHARFCRKLSPAEMPVEYWGGFAFWVAIALGTVALVLAVYLIMAR